jgi:hypothetical protein
MNNDETMSQAEIFALYEKERRAAMDELFEEQRRAVVEKMSGTPSDEFLAQGRIVGAGCPPFRAPYQPKYDKAAACLAKDRQALLAVYDFPAEHWKHLRTSNPIQSTFATVPHRTVRAKGCLANKTALAMVFKLVEAGQKSWRRLDGHNQLPKLIQGVRSTDGIEIVARPAASQSQSAAA